MKTEELSLERVFIVSACRTPIGKTAGSLSGLSDVDLMSQAFGEAVTRLGHEGVVPDGVYTGCCFPQENYNLARKAHIKAGLPYTIPGATINRTCCSSMEALIQGARQIMVGDADIILVGGVENMSRSPHVMKNAVKKARMAVNGKLPVFNDIKGDLIDDIGLSIEVLARRLKIERVEQDETAYMSHKKAAEAQKEGYFEDEIFPVEVQNENSERSMFTYDENIVQKLSLEKISGEKPIFISDGTLTKLNSSSINDGASAVVLMSEKAVVRLGMKPLAEYLHSETIGVRPEDVGIAPALAVKKLLDRHGISMKALDLIECNEAYAVQLAACKKLLGWDENKVNVNGGSLALGHPLGCTGLRICITLIYSMLRRQDMLGMATMCAGGGMGQCILFAHPQRRCHDKQKI